MVNGIIYCAISPSNKKYYGYSSLNLEIRKQRHKYKFLKNKISRFYTAIKKYGWDNFKWDIIENHIAENKKELKDILCEREKYWIAKDKTTSKEFGYNMTDGGDGTLGFTMSEKQRLEISKNMALVMIGNTNNNGKRRAKGRTTYRKGSSLRDEMIRKYGEEEGVKRHKIWLQNMGKSHCKSILQLDKNDNFIKEWASIKMAHDAGFEGTNISACLKGRRKTHKKYKWRYK